jgi:hypothetical protein
MKDSGLLLLACYFSLILYGRDRQCGYGLNECTNHSAKQTVSKRCIDLETANHGSALAFLAFRIPDYRVFSFFFAPLYTTFPRFYTYQHISPSSQTQSYTPCEQHLASCSSETQSESDGTYVARKSTTLITQRHATFTHFHRNS